MKTNLLVFLFLFICSLLSSQATTATFSNPGLDLDGTCNSESPSTIFSIDMDIAYDLEPGGNYIVYLVDCENQVLDVLIFNSAQNNTQYFAVYEDPICSPFKIFATNDFPDLLTGDIFTGTEIGTFEFDPSLLDSDCAPSFNSSIEFICIDGTECGEVPEPQIGNSDNLALPDVIFECPIDNVIAEQNMRAGPAEYGWGAFSDPAYGQIVGDDFVATETGEVTEICWYGAYALGDKLPDGDDNFTITYYDNMIFEDNNGMVTIPEYNVPGNIIAEFSINNNDIVREKAPFLTSPFGYSAKHDPVPVTMGERYWVVIKNEISDNDYWVWVVSQDFISELSTLEWVPPRPPTNRYYPATFAPSCVGCEGLMFTVGYAVPIPTLSEWGILSLSISLLIFGLIAVRRQRSSLA